MTATLLALLPTLLLQLPAEDVRRAREMANGKLELARRIAADGELVKAITSKNAVTESGDEIRKRDQDWLKNPSYPLRKQLTQNACAERLRQIVEADTTVVEAFLMDSRGGLVCATVETSDYFQGDEAKWSKTYGEGKFVYIDAPALDYSTNTVAIQLSMIVLDGPRKVGALTLTLKVPRLRTQGSSSTPARTAAAP
jgi:hypothetical protein